MKKLILIFTTFFVLANVNAQQSLEGTEWWHALESDLANIKTQDDFEYELEWNNFALKFDTKTIKIIEYGYGYYEESYTYYPSSQSGYWYEDSKKFEFQITKFGIFQKMVVKKFYEGGEDAIFLKNNAIFKTSAPTATASNTSTESVINGVTWATKNVGNTPKNFAKTHNEGGYYNWEDAKTVCPKGWRLPTKEELQSLLDAGSVWTTIDGQKGRLFGSGKNTIFLPAKGDYYDDTMGIILDDDTGFYYSNSSTTHNYGIVWVYYLTFDRSGDDEYTTIKDKGIPKVHRFSCRCVKE
jgi:uncharacterized protein (TIGR02145 family)